MKKHIILTAGMAALVLAGAVSPAVMAWGPSSRPTYTMNSPAAHATFNSITDNTAVQDERDFVRIAEKNVGATYSSNISVSGGKQYEVYIYFHNDASETYNTADYNYQGVATDTRLSTIFPLALDKGEKGVVSGVISWSTLADRTAIQQVWDEAYVTATEKITLHYVTGSAKIYNGFSTNGSVLSTNIFSADGIFLGLNELNGVILGCSRYSGHVVYTIQTQKVEEEKKEEPKDEDPEEEKKEDEKKEEEPEDGTGDEQEDPEPTIKPDIPETPNVPEVPDTAVPTTPSELPNTGPTEIVLAVGLVLVVAAMVAYWGLTHKAVKKATKKAKGRK